MNNNPFPRLQFHFLFEINDDHVQTIDMVFIYLFTT